MYERFTEQARRVMQMANQAAQDFHHTYIGREHVLVALVREESGVASSVLRDLGVDLQKVRLQVEKFAQPGPDAGLAAVRGAKKLIEYSIEAARDLHHDYVGTEHLLLGLLRERESVAARVLISLGVKLEAVRARVLNLLGNNPQAEGSAEGGGEPALVQFGTDLTELARQSKLEPAFGRAGEIEQIIEILGRRTKCNPVLLGSAGVGRTTIVKGLAQRIADNLVPEFLRTRRIVAMDIFLLIGDEEHRGGFRDRMKAVLSEARRDKSVILFFEYFEALVGGGGLEDVDASNLLVPGLARGEIQCIGETTAEDYQSYLERDGALERRFQRVPVDLPPREVVVEILKSRRGEHEARHHVRITDEAVAAAVELSGLYVWNGRFPPSAEGLMNEAAARVAIQSRGLPPGLKELDGEIEQLDRGKEAAVAEQDFQEAARLRDRADELKKEKLRLLKDWGEKSHAVGGVVDAEAVVETLSRSTRIPAEKIRQRDTSGGRGC
jgi:ATP-dependent Clp protease ATP-binding subunit ClpC